VVKFFLFLTSGFQQLAADAEHVSLRRGTGLEAQEDQLTFQGLLLFYVLFFQGTTFALFLSL
jgi:hypothetical protein